MSHGHTRGRCWSPTYVVWHSMLARCSQAFRTDAESYWGKGIRVCTRWQGAGGFEHFLADMGERPVDEAASTPARTVYKTLGRLDSNGDYEPGNCEWQTRAQQNRGLHSLGTRHVTIGGVTATYAEWAEAVGVKYASFLRRLERGWTPEEACSVRYRRTRRKHAVQNARDRNGCSPKC